MGISHLLKIGIAFPERCSIADTESINLAIPDIDTNRDGRVSRALECACKEIRDLLNVRDEPSRSTGD